MVPGPRRQENKQLIQNLDAKRLDISEADLHQSLPRYLFCVKN